MARKDPRYRRLNALGFLCCASFLAYLFVCLEIPAGTHASPFSSLSRIIILSSTVLFFLALLFNPHTTGQRIFSLLNLLLVGGGVYAAGKHLWIQAEPGSLTNPLTGCDTPFEALMAQHASLPDKLSNLFALSGQCSAEVLGPFGIGYPIQALLLFVLLLLLSWKTLIFRPNPEGMFQ